MGELEISVNMDDILKNHDQAMKLIIYDAIEDTKKAERQLCIDIVEIHRRLIGHVPANDLLDMIIKELE